MWSKHSLISYTISSGAAVLLTLLLNLFGIGVKPAMANADLQQSTTPMTHTMPMTPTTPMTPTMARPGGMIQPGGMQPGMMQEQMMGMMKNMQSMMANMQTLMQISMMQSSTMQSDMVDKGMMKQSGMIMSESMMRENMLQCHMLFMMAHMNTMMGGGMMGDMSLQGESMMGADKPEMKALLGMMADMQAMMANMQTMMGSGMMGGGMMGGAGMAPAAPASPPAAANVQPGNEAMTQSAQLKDIEVKATPTNLTDPHELAFTIDLNASGVDLGFDLANQATLKVGDLVIPATAWEVAYDHGHHVNGVLKFAHHGKVKLAAGDEVTIVIKHPNGSDEATLHWSAPNG